jgi:ABC-type glycerol-3-phosphate transport system substrate-binding protein
MKKTRFVSLAAALLMFLAVLPCFGGAKRETASENVEITFMSNILTSTGIDHLKAIVDAYRKDGVTIKYEPVVGGTGEYQQKLETMFAGGVYPDVCYIPTLWSKRHAAMGHAYDLTDALSKEVFNDFLEGPLATVTYKGRYIGLPFNSDCVSVYYNKNMFAKAGIKVPASYNDVWNWKQLIDVATAVKQANGTRYGLVIWNDFSCILPFIWQTGATVLNPDQTKVTINQPGTIKALNWFRDQWLKSGLCSEEVFMGVENAGDLFRQQASPIVIFQSGNLGGLIDDVKDFEFGMTYLPVDVTAGNKIGGWNMEVINKSAHIKESLDFFNYIMDTQTMNTFCAATGNMPTRKSSIQTIKFGRLDPYAPIVMNEIAAIPAVCTDDCVTPAYQTYKNILAAEFQNFLITPSMTAAQAAAEMEKQVSQALF